MKLFFVILLFLMAGMGVSFAQSFDSLVITQTPQNPKVGEMVRLELESFSDDLNRSTITWYVSQKIVLQGKGKKSYSLSMPGEASPKIISVIVRTPQGKVLEQELELKAGGVDLVFETIDSYVPPFYKGKALPGEESVVKVVAMPATQKAIGGAQTGVYQWKKNGSNMPMFSGFGKQTYTLQLDPFNQSEQVGVVFESTQEQELVVIPQQVELRLYETNPRVGVLYQTELNGEISLTNREVSLVAEPFFFSPGNKMSDMLRYVWNINGTVVQSGKDKSTIILRGGSDSAGLGSVGVEVSNTLKSMQTGRKNLKIRFE